MDLSRFDAAALIAFKEVIAVVPQSYETRVSVYAAIARLSIISLLNFAGVLYLCLCMIQFSLYIWLNLRSANRSSSMVLKRLTVSGVPTPRTI